MKLEKVVVERTHQNDGVDKKSTPSGCSGGILPFFIEEKRKMENCYRIVKCQGDVNIERGMGDAEVMSDALNLGISDEVCTCDSEEDGLKTLTGFKNSFSYFTSCSNRYANATVYWLVKCSDEDGEDDDSPHASGDVSGEFEFLETADWE